MLCFRQSGHFLLATIDVCRKVSAPAGSYLWAWNLIRLSRLYLLSGQVQPAIAAVRDVSEQMPRGPEKSLALLSLGNCYRRAGQLQEAQRSLEAVFSLPECSWSLYHMERDWGPLRESGAPEMGKEHELARRWMPESR